VKDVKDQQRCPLYLRNVELKYKLFDWEHARTKTYKHQGYIQSDINYSVTFEKINHTLRVDGVTRRCEFESEFFNFSHQRKFLVGIPQMDPHVAQLVMKPNKNQRRHIPVPVIDA
jgi:hypothetical protein